MDTPEKKILKDTFGREVSYLRLSVTDRCNLRCKYCMPEKMKFVPREQVLTLEEIYILASVFVDLGVNSIRLTGGEPLIRKNILWLVKALSELNYLKELTLTTNGIKLPMLAGSLKTAGLSRINISLDSLRPQRFSEITRVGELEQVLKGIEAAIDAKFNKIRLNAVIQKGFNDDEVSDLVNFSIDKGLDIAFIEEMPLGDISSHQRNSTQITGFSLREQLSEKFNLQLSDHRTAGPSKYYSIANSETKVGFISPISDNFCGSCNRVRLTSEGRLLLCLGNENSIDLRAIIRQNFNNKSALKKAIREALTLKPERHYFDPNKTEIVRFMNMTGG